MTRGGAELIAPAIKAALFMTSPGARDPGAGFRFSGLTGAVLLRTAVGLPGAETGGETPPLRGMTVGLPNGSIDRELLAWGRGKNEG